MSNYISLRHGAVLCDVDVWEFMRVAKACHAVRKVRGVACVMLTRMPDISEKIKEERSKRYGCAMV